MTAHQTCVMYGYTSTSDHRRTVVVNLKAAVNAFYNTLMLCGPYGGVSSHEPLCVQVKHMASICGLEVEENNKECLYMCDSLAMKTIQAVLQKVPLSKSGLAWPHVLYNGESVSFFWLLKEDIEWNSTCYTSLTPCPKVWFVIPSSFEQLFDFVLEKLYLSIEKTSCKVHQHHLLGFPDHCTIRERKISVTMVNNKPGDIIVTILSAGKDSAKVELNISDSCPREHAAVNHSCETIIVAECRDVNRHRHSSLSEDIIANEYLYTEHHTIIWDVPHWLNDVLNIGFKSAAYSCLVSDAQLVLRLKEILLALNEEYNWYMEFANSLLVTAEDRFVVLKCEDNSFKGFGCEITVKDELLDEESNNACDTGCDTTISEDSFTLSFNDFGEDGKGNHHSNDCLDRAERRAQILRREMDRNRWKMFVCPLCAFTCKNGTNGDGLKRLNDHVASCHSSANQNS